MMNTEHNDIVIFLHFTAIKSRIIYNYIHLYHTHGRMWQRT